MICNGSKNFVRFILRPIIDHDQLDLVVILVEHAIDRPQESTGAVVGWQNYGDEWGNGVDGINHAENFLL